MRDDMDNARLTGAGPTAVRGLQDVLMRLIFTYFS